MSNTVHAQTPIPELAETCVDFVRRAVGLELDYTQETLPILDHYVRQARAAASDPAVLAPLLPATGGYFGALILRMFRGARVIEGADYPHCRVEFAPFFLHFNPVGVAQEVLTLADAPGWNAHFSTLEDQQQVLEDSLRRAPEIRPEDYYTFSLRYETLDHIVAVLTALEEQRGPRRRTFGPDVYAAMLGEPVAAQS